jgi:hypothetical protein
MSFLLSITHSKYYFYIPFLIIFIFGLVAVSLLFEKEITFPVYDSKNPEMVLVGNLSQLKQALERNVRIVFVKPGNYFDSQKIDNIVVLTGSGTKKEPRYLIYYDPENPQDNTHPVHMSVSKQAIFRNIWLKSANYWIIDRLTVEKSSVQNQIFGSGEIGRKDVEGTGRPIQAGTSGHFIPSSHNILNRMLYQQMSEDVLVIYEGCHYNTIQNSVLRNNTLPDKDWVGIITQAWHGRAHSAEIIGTLIKNNEIYDINGGIQLFDHEKITLNPDYRKTKIINNDIYITPSIYSDGKGKLTANGEFAAAEYSIAIKAGTSSMSSEDAIIIEGNRMWGMRLLDPHIAGSHSHGAIVVLSNIYLRGEKINGNIHIKDNIIMDTLNGITSQGLLNVVIDNNIIYDVKQMNHDGNIFKYENSAPLTIVGKGHSISNNLLINGDHLWLWSHDSHNLTFENNTIINFPKYYLKDSYKVVADDNEYYNAPQLERPGTNDIVSTKIPLSDYETKQVKRKLITAPEVISIPYGKR